MTQPKKRNKQTAKPKPSSGKKASADVKTRARQQRIEEERKAQIRTHEIMGLLFIAIGLFLLIAFLGFGGYVSEVLQGFCYGLFGVLLYAIPVILMAYGVFVIVTADREFHALKGLLILGVCICLLSLMHSYYIGKAGHEMGSYVDFLATAFYMGETTHIGGGIFGALLSYFLLKFVGVVGSYIFFGTCIIILAMVLTNLSLQDAGQKVSKVIRENMSARQERRERHREELERENEMRIAEQIELEKQISLQEKAKKLEAKGEVMPEKESEHSKYNRKKQEKSSFLENEISLTQGDSNQLPDESHDRNKKRQELELGSDFNLSVDSLGGEKKDELSIEKTFPAGKPRKSILRSENDADQMSGDIDENKSEALDLMPGGSIPKAKRSPYPEDDIDLMPKRGRLARQGSDDTFNTDNLEFHPSKDQERSDYFDRNVVGSPPKSFTLETKDSDLFYDFEEDDKYRQVTDSAAFEEDEFYIREEELEQVDYARRDYGRYEPYLPPLRQKPTDDFADEGLWDGEDITQENIEFEHDIDFTEKVYEDEKEAFDDYDLEDFDDDELADIPGFLDFQGQDSRNEKKGFVKPIVHEQPLQMERKEKFAPKEKEENPAQIQQQRFSTYQMPPIELLDPTPRMRGPQEDVHNKAQRLEATLKDFGIVAKVVNMAQGPVITRFELQPAPGVRVNRITNLSDDIALALAAPSVRIEAPIPGKAAVGIEIPNQSRGVVSLRELIESSEYKASTSKIAVPLGRDISGKVVVADIAKMPHLLIAGSTGSGKSVCINTIICSLLYHATPEEVRLIMVDPKVVELASFARIPHLLIPVVTESERAAKALQWGVREMMSRYNSFAEKGTRDLSRYNQIAKRDGFETLPQIVIIIDELADLMMVAPNDVEDAICRIAQMGRAAGIHLIVATQRPSADIITGLIKANVPSRIAFAVASATDSRIILDAAGADKLLGKGDMLFSPIGASQPRRVQGALVTDDEIERIADYFNSVGQTAEFDQSAADEIAKGLNVEKNGNTDAGGTEDFDPLLPEIVEMFMSQGQASVSMIQRRMRVGYAKAGRLIDELEQMGIVSAANGSKPREILIGRVEFEQIFGYAPNIDDLGT